MILTGAVCACLGASVASASELARTFAGCVGRMSAEMEHAWLTSDPAAAEFEGKRQAFLALLDATLPKGREADALNHRIEAKMAHASLLTVATFADRNDRADQARMRAAWHRTACNTLLLDG